MAISNTTLTAGCFVSQGTRVMQIAGRLTESGLRACYYYSLSPARELEETQNHTKDASATKDYDYNDMPGIPVIVSIHQNLERSSMESVLIINADTGELEAGNDDGLLPPLVAESDPRAVKRMNKFFGREAFVIAGGGKQTRKASVPRPVVKAKRVEISPFDASLDVAVTRLRARLTPAAAEQFLPQMTK